MARKYPANETGVHKAADAVRDGGVVIYPTETCYGIGGDALREHVIDRVYELKQRPRDKPLTAIVSDVDMAERYARLTPEERALCEELMPGPLTIIAEKKPVVPDALNESFVFRIPGNETARRLSAEADTPIIATSANISGQSANYSIDTIDPVILDKVDVVLDGGKLEQTASSTIVRVTEHEARIVREGPIGKDALGRVLNTWQQDRSFRKDSQ